MTSAFSLIVVVALQAAAGGTPAQAPMPGVTTIERGSDSAVDTPRQVTARSDAEWAKIWQAHSSEHPRPAIDFTHTMVVGVFMGSKPTAGFGVEIVGTRVDGGTLIVQDPETKPGADRMTAQVLTSPYHLATIPRFDGDVKFEALPAK